MPYIDIVSCFTDVFDFGAIKWGEGDLFLQKGVFLVFVINLVDKYTIL